MNVIKAIKLTLDNPANILTTTTKSMLETSVVSLELDKEKELSQDEKNGIIELINYAINKRVNDKATSISYTGLINLKNKLYE